MMISISTILFSYFLLLLPFISLVYGMDYGQAGVYDSPMATDYYVKRFGFLFGGGRSGNSGLQAMQVISITKPNQFRAYLIRKRLTWATRTVCLQLSTTQVDSTG